jgi:hypothetical protein
MPTELQIVFIIAGIIIGSLIFWIVTATSSAQDRQMSRQLWEASKRGEMPEHVWLPGNYYKYVRQFEHEERTRPVESSEVGYMADPRDFDRCVCGTIKRKEAEKCARCYGDRYLLPDSHWL